MKTKRTIWGVWRDTVPLLAVALLVIGGFVYGVVRAITH